MARRIPHTFYTGLLLYGICFAFLGASSLSGAAVVTLKGLALPFVAAIVASFIVLMLVVMRLVARLGDPDAVFVQTLFGIAITTLALFRINPAFLDLLTFVPVIWLAATILKLRPSQATAAGATHFLGCVAVYAYPMWFGSATLRLGSVLNLATIVAVDGALVLVARHESITHAEHEAQAAQLMALHEQLRRQTEEDPYTNTLKRHYFIDLMRRETLRAERYEGRFCVMQIAMDKFYDVIRSHGAPVTLQVLREISERMIGNIRQMDAIHQVASDEELLGRIGNARFAVLLPETALAGGAQCAERLRQQMELQPVRTADGVLPVTVSIGVTEFIRGDTVDALLERSEQALQKAQHTGGNDIETIEPRREEV